MLTIITFIISLTSFATLAQEQKVQPVVFSDAFVQKDPGIIDAIQLKLTGVFPDSCYKWQTAQVNHVDDFVHEVRGIATVTPGICTMALVPFTKDVDLGVLKEGNHIARVLNGNGTVIEKRFTKSR